MTAIAFIKEESLGSEPLCGGVEAAGRSGQGYDHPTKGVTRRGYCVGRERQSPCLRPNIAEGHMLALIMDVSP